MVFVKFGLDHYSSCVVSVNVEVVTATVDGGAKA